MGWKYYLFVQFNSTSTTFKKPEKGKERGEKKKRNPFRGQARSFIISTQHPACLPRRRKRWIIQAGEYSGKQLRRSCAECLLVYTALDDSRAERKTHTARACVTCFSRVAVNRVRSGTRVLSPLLICSDVYERAAGASAPPVMHARGSS